MLDTIAGFGLGCIKTRNISSNKKIGLLERALRDFSVMGRVTPHMKISIFFVFTQPASLPALRGSLQLFANESLMCLANA
jgi:hypothetical protein